MATKENINWKRINMGDTLPCQSFLRKKNGEILKLSTVGGVKVGQDCYYLPVDEVINVIKDYPVEESKDERIRKKLLALIEWSKSYAASGITTDEAKEMTAWLEEQDNKGMGISESTKQKLEDNLNKALEQETPDSLNKFLEKQGEQILANSVKICKDEQKSVDKVEPKFKVGDEIKTKNEESLIITRIDRWGYWSEDLFICNFDDADKWELVEQKPTEWSEEDEMMLHYAIEHFERQKRNCIEGGGRKKAMQEFIDWLKSLKDRVQPKQEWSEEIEGAISLLNDMAEEQEKDYCPHNANDLRKAAQYLETCRPQNTWKPSDEMLEALYRVIPENVMEKSEDEMLLDKLYQGLKYGKVLSEK